MRDAKASAALNLIIDTFLHTLYSEYVAVDDVAATREDLAVSDSSGADGATWKYSYHGVVLPYAVADCEEAREFTAVVVAALPPLLRPLIDATVNKRLQNFRLAGNAKAGSARVKTFSPALARQLGTAAAAPDETMIVAPPGMRVLARIFDTAPKARENDRGHSRVMPAATITAVLTAVADLTAAHAYRGASGARLDFDRRRPSHCALCDAPHRKDNTLMLMCRAARGAAGRVDVVEYCRHARGKSRVVATVAGRLGFDDAVAARDKQQVDVAAPGARVAAVRAGHVDAHAAAKSAFETTASKHMYSEDKMREYELVPTLAVKAQMKLGKTRALRAYLDTYFSAAVRTPVIRFISFRQTFSSSLKTSFPDFALYSEQKGDLDHVRFPRLIVQVESLHRLPMAANPEPVDVVILDEVESILSQFNSGLHKHFNAVFAMFRWLIRTARHVVVMDANLTDRTYNLLATMRPAHPVHFHWNMYARAKGDVYHFTADQSVWLEKLYTTVRDGKRVVVASNSLAEAQASAETLRSKFPDKKIGEYSSKTAESVKRRHFSDVHTHWTALDVLIYTPTVSAGVSYELEHFDVLFGYFTDRSCDVETCRQMLGRVRDIGTRAHYICLRGLPNNQPTETADIRRLVNAGRASLYRALDDAALQFEYAPDGRARAYSSDYFDLWLETTRINNLSKNAFVDRFIDQVADSGATVLTMAASASAETQKAILEEHKQVKRDISATHAFKVAAAPVMTDDEAQRVADAFSRNADVPELDILGLEQWKVRRAYDLKHAVSAAFVQTYSCSGARAVFRNLQAITAEATVAASLRTIRDREQVCNQFAMEGRVAGREYAAEARDLQRRHLYTFPRHHAALLFLQTCGFACVFDPARIAANVLEVRLRGALHRLNAEASKIAFEFGMKVLTIADDVDPLKFTQNALARINPVLRAMYGIYVRRAAKNAPYYYLSVAPLGRLFSVVHIAAADAAEDVDDENAEDDVGFADERPRVLSRLRPILDNPAADFLDEKYVEVAGRQLYDRPRDNVPLMADADAAPPPRVYKAAAPGDAADFLAFMGPLL